MGWPVPLLTVLGLVATAGAVVAEGESEPDEGAAKTGSWVGTEDAEASQADGQEAEGGLPREVIARIVSRHRGELRFCYERRLAEQPDLFGSVTTLFVIDATGAVSVSHVYDQLGDPSLATCMISRIQRWRFPEPQGGGIVRVTYPWHFSPRSSTSRGVFLWAEVLDGAEAVPGRVSILEAHRPAFEACMAGHDGEPVDGVDEPSISLHIGSDGTVIRATLLGLPEDGEQGTCILGVLRSLTFPAPRGGGSIQAAVLLSHLVGGRSDLEQVVSEWREFGGLEDPVSIIDAHTPRARLCYEERAREVGDLTPEVRVAVTIDAHGIVTDAKVTHDEDAILEACIAKAARAMVFPGPTGGVRIKASYGWEFPPLEDPDPVRGDRLNPSEPWPAPGRAAFRSPHRAAGAWGFAPRGAWSLEAAAGVGAVPPAGAATPERESGPHTHGRFVLTYAFTSAVEGRVDALVAPWHAWPYSVSAGLRGRLVEGEAFVPDVALEGAMAVSGFDVTTGLSGAVQASWPTPWPLSMHAQIEGLLWHHGRENVVLMPALGARWALGADTDLHAEAFGRWWVDSGVSVHRGPGLAAGVTHRLTSAVTVAAAADLYAGAEGPAAAVRLAVRWLFVPDAADRP
jgi:outer membrane biosynthesis protein TonB